MHAQNRYISQTFISKTAYEIVISKTFSLYLFIMFIWLHISQQCDWAAYNSELKRKINKFIRTVIAENNKEQ